MAGTIMTTQAETRFYIMRPGALKEELREWTEIESMCQMGHLTPETLIFIHAEEQWKKITDTELGRYFEDYEPAQDEGLAGAEARQALAENEEYKEVLLRINESPDDWNLRLQAAGMALAGGDRESAIEHYQAALDERPYHPRVANEAIRNLTPAEQNAMRHLKQVGPFWEEPLVFLTYPFRRSYIYPAVLAGLLWLSTLLPVARVVGVFIAFFWAFHVIRSVARKEELPPMLDSVASDPIGKIVRPIVSLVALAAELYLPLLVFLQVLAMTGAVEEANAFAYIGSSPFVMVAVFTVSAIYLPAALMLMAATPRGHVDALNPIRVIAAIGIMEFDYLMALVLFFAVSGVSAAIGALTWRIPIAGTLPTAVVEAYLALVMGCVLGMIFIRFKDRVSGWATQPPEAR